MKIEVLGRYSFANYKLASKIDVHNVIHKPRLSHPHRISRHYLRTSDDRLIIFDKIIYKVIRALAPPSTDYGLPVRKSPSLHGRKSTPTLKFLGTAEAYFVCHIGPNFQISLIYAFIGCP